MEFLDLRNCGEDHWEILDQFPYLIKRFSDKVDRPDECKKGAVVLPSGVIVGILLWKPHGNDPSDLHFDIAVSESHEGKGVAGMLIEGALGHASEGDFHTISAMCVNPLVSQMLERRGFECRDDYSNTWEKMV